MKYVESLYKKYEIGALAWLKAEATFNSRGPEITYRNKRSSILPELSEHIADSSQMAMSASAPGSASVGQPMKPEKRKLELPSSYEVDEVIVAGNCEFLLGELKPYFTDMVSTITDGD